MMLNKEDSNYPDEYYSDGESHKYSTSRNDFDVKDLKSSISKIEGLSNRKNSLTSIDHLQLVKHNSLLSKPSIPLSRLSS